jgi:protein-tyrosine phosphatase
MLLTEFPFSLPGRIFRSQMPFRYTDPDGEIFREYQRQGVSVVVMLVSDEEAQNRTGLDLRAFYQAHGMQVIHLPIVDFGATSPQAVSQAVDAALDCAQAGKNVAVHCYAGYGRTGMFLACLARRVFAMTPEAAILWVRSYVPTSIEVPEQIEVVRQFQ